MYDAPLIMIALPSKVAKAQLSIVVPTAPRMNTAAIRPSPAPHKDFQVCMKK